MKKDEIEDEELKKLVEDDFSFFEDDFEDTSSSNKKPSKEDLNIVVKPKKEEKKIVVKPKKQEVEKTEEKKKNQQPHKTIKEEKKKIEKKIEIKEGKKTKNKETDENKENIKLMIGLLIIFVLILLAGLYVYITYKPIILENLDNKLSEEECSDEEDFYFFSALENCTPIEYIKTTENLGFLTLYTKLENNYFIKGYNQENKCEIEITTIDAKVSYDLQEILTFIENPKNKENIYYQYLLISNFDENFEENIDPTEDKINEAVLYIKEQIINYYSTLSVEELNQLKETENEIQEAYKNNVETCFFEDTDKLKKLLKDKFKGIIQEVHITTKFNLETGKSETTATYDGGKCISVN